MNEVEFSLEVDSRDADLFGELSQDFNPLHLDEEYAKNTQFGGRVLHGAYSAGLLSRVAGMHIPGRDCLLQGMKLNFLSPVLLPMSLTVKAREVLKRQDYGKVKVEIFDSQSGTKLVVGHYEYTSHSHFESKTVSESQDAPVNGKIQMPSGDAKFLITGSNGALGGALLRGYGESAIGLARNHELPADMPVKGIIHCGWPGMDDTGLLDIEEESLYQKLSNNLTQPLEQMISLARILKNQGQEGAGLVFIGSTAADLGRHNFRAPLYSLSKSLLPTLGQILALELSKTSHRCINVIFDMLDGGMNSGLSNMAKQMQQSRLPSGKLPDISEAVDQIKWVMENQSSMLNGCSINLSGCALP